MAEKSDWEKTQENNRNLAQQRASMGKDPGGYFPDIKAQYDRQQAELKAQKSQREQSSNSGCFPAGSLIDTPYGQRKIEEISPDDIVISFDSSRQHLVEERVLARKEHPKNRVLTISFRDCESLRVTAKHSFLVEGRWKTTESLRPGDKISHVCRGTITSQTVADVEQCGDVETVYNLTTSGAHNFLVFGFVAHNFTHFRRLRMAYWRVRLWLFAAGARKPIWRPLARA